MNAPICPCPPLSDEEPVSSQHCSSNHWYRLVDRFGQDTRCPACEGRGFTCVHRRCPRCRGTGERQAQRPAKALSFRQDYQNACSQTRWFRRYACSHNDCDSIQFTTTAQDVLTLSIHLPRPYDQPLFCLHANAQHSQRIADALGRTLLQQGCAV